MIDLSSSEHLRYLILQVFVSILIKTEHSSFLFIKKGKISLQNFNIDCFLLISILHMSFVELVLLNPLYSLNSIELELRIVFTSLIIFRLVFSSLNFKNKDDEDVMVAPKHPSPS